ncbi:MAG: hypothetical protein KF729_16395 [Sandaracinaceae bacterium]|nr:hypothetical protein [Sandaracinaceae bacterium]
MTRRWAALVLAASCAGPGATAPEARSTQADPPPRGEVCDAATDVRVRGFCVDPTGERDAAPALARVIASLPEQTPGLGTPVELPENAVLRIDDADGDGVGVRIDRRVILDARGAVLRVTGDHVGVRLTAAARYSLLRDLTIEGAARRHGGIGLDVRANGIRLDNLMIRRLGTAIRAHSRLDTGQTCASAEDCACDGVCDCREGRCSAGANVNLQRWANVLIVQCGRGVWLRGGDANAGLFSGLDIRATPEGIVDDSFLGNVYVAPALESASERSIALLQPASYSTVLGGYIERDGAHAEGPAGALFVGGSAVPYVRGPAERVGMRSARLTFRHLDSNLRVTIPGNEHAALAWRHPSEGWGWQLRRFEDEGASRWGFSHQGSVGRTYFFTDQIPGLRQWQIQHPQRGVAP